MEPVEKSAMGEPSGNGNGRVWKIAGYVAVPAYALLAWTLWTTAENRTSIVQHEERFLNLRADIAAAKVDSGKDLINMQRDFNNLKLDLSTAQQGVAANQNKIESAIQGAQQEMRTKIDGITATINEIKVQLGIVNRYSKK